MTLAVDRMDRALAQWQTVQDTGQIEPLWSPSDAALSVALVKNWPAVKAELDRRADELAALRLRETAMREVVRAARPLTFTMECEDPNNGSPCGRCAWCALVAAFARLDENKLGERR